MSVKVLAREQPIWSSSQPVLQQLELVLVLVPQQLVQVLVPPQLVQAQQVPAACLPQQQRAPRAPQLQLQLHQKAEWRAARG